MTAHAILPEEGAYCAGETRMKLGGGRISPHCDTVQSAENCEYENG
jgi:hypothetical protein